MSTKPFVYQDPFPLGKDETTYRKIEGSEKYITGGEICRQGRRPGLPRGALDPGQRGHAGCLLPAASGPQRAGSQDPRRPRGLHERQGRGPGLPAQRRDRRPVRPAGLPGYRHRHRGRQEGTAGLDRRQGRGVALQGDLQDLHRGKPALLPDRGPGHVRGDQHRHQPAGPDRHPGHRRRLLQIPLHGQGGRFRQQDHALPGDQGAADTGQALQVPGRKDEIPGHRRLPALPYRLRHRRHLGRRRA